MNQKKVKRGNPKPSASLALPDSEMTIPDHLQATVIRWSECFRRRDRTERIMGFIQINKEARKLRPQGDALQALRLVTRDPKTAKRLLDLHKLDGRLLNKATSQADSEVARSRGITATHLLDLVGVLSKDDRKSLFQRCMVETWPRQRLQQEIRISNRRRAAADSTNRIYGVVKPLLRARAVHVRIDNLIPALDDIASQEFVDNVTSTKTAAKADAAVEYQKLSKKLKDMQLTLEKAVANLNTAKAMLKKSL